METNCCQGFCLNLEDMLLFMSAYTMAIAIDVIFRFSKIVKISRIQNNLFSIAHCLCDVSPAI